MSSPRAAVDVRTITPDELPEWCRALDIGFLRSTAPEHLDALVELRRAWADLTRTVGAFDGDRCVATFRSGPQVLTVPGGATLTASGVTNVTVTATHRRQGLLTAMMRQELEAGRERDEPLAILDSAEYGIYGRFGFGPATSMVNVEVDVHRAALGRYVPPPDGRLDLASPAELGKHGPEVHDRFRLTRHGALARTDTWWRVATGELRNPRMDGYRPFHVLYRDGSGRVDGFLSYEIDDVWAHNRPEGVLRVHDLIAATPQAEAALWRYALSVDWVSRVTAENRAPDDVLPLLLGDARALRYTTLSDFVWVRPLRVERLLAARTYGAPGALVLEVHDAAGFAAGRFLLDGGPDGASCTRTTRSAQVTLDAAALGTLYLGDESAARLAAVGRVTAVDDAAVAGLDAMFRTGRRPWCPDGF